jgi:hypothetical protein
MTLLRSTLRQLSRGRGLAASKCVYCSNISVRPFASEAEGNADKKESWFGKILRGDPTQMSSSAAVGTASVLYRLVFIQTKPEYEQEFIRMGSEALPKFAETDGSCRLLAAWRTDIGDTGEIVHLWQYRDGYKSIDENNLSVAPNDQTEDNSGSTGFDFEVYQKYKEDTRHMILSQRSEILMQFGFWDSPRERTEKHVYDLRTYHLKPGSMIEWANHWSTGIEVRKTHNQDVAGMFTHIGELYTVHHIWAYKSFQERKAIREASWQIPGWSATVANTVPLIRTVQTRIMTALPYSNLK